ncbi:PAS domain-containing sensor histidine kinase [Chelatococcus sp. SYSU_G07232]|uniref:histidine kinase n=1 Tax=Chelatococcus albus TaxID=3047466 RepID=A0ABT7AI63_9HYPH|nr:PAS domain-containing sensor histidine kinase [Chelatococcus sp. SYSU_G07232]MDJ1159053.1 PAS domain-containing sensor histidine kinase [Chelatococcus sp. SYSU_G07232]
MSPSASMIRARLAALVHPAAAADAEACARHEQFILTRLVAGFVALAAVPPYLALWGVPSGAQTVALAALALPIAAVALLSRTGRLDLAHALSSAAFALIVAAVACATGGAESPAIAWLVAVPLEALLSGSRRAVVAASLIAAAAAVGVAAADAAGWLAASGGGAPAAAMPAFLVTAVAYAAALGLAACRRESERLGDRARREARDRAVLETIGDLVTWHERGGAVVFASAAAERLVGVPARSLHGRGLFDRVHVADRPLYLKALADAAHRGVAVTVEFRLHRSVAGEGGRAPTEVAWVEMRAQRPEPAGPAPAGADADTHAVVAVIRDITERRSHEAEREAARAEAERASEQKGRFLATVSHELRTPLNAVIGFSEMLASGTLAPADEARRREYAGIIRDSGRHLLDVVNTLLDLSRIEAGHVDLAPEAFDTAELARGCCDLMQLKADEAGIVLQRDIAADRGEIVADRRALKQILINLLSNALKFTPAGGRVTVSVRRTSDRFVLVVADTGIGIGERDLPRLGDPFFQVRSAPERPRGWPQEGTGLGLSVVRGLVGLHHGTMTIASTPGEGTTVTVALPQDCRVAPAAATSLAAEVPLARRQAAPTERDAVKKRA